MQKQIIDKKIRFYVIDGYKVAKMTGMGARVNTIMQTCFFAISGVLPREEAIEAIKHSIKKSYGSKGEEVVKKNYEAVEQTLANLFEVKVPAESTSKLKAAGSTAGSARICAVFTARIIAGEGDNLPVSAFPVDGTFPTGTAQWEKRNIALEIPSGIRMSASSAANAPSRARMQPSASRSTMRSFLKRRRPLSNNGGQRERFQAGHALYGTDCAGRLHRMRSLRGCLPGAE